MKKKLPKGKPIKGKIKPKLPPTISDPPNPHPISRFDLDRPEPLRLSTPVGETLAAHCETFPKFKVLYVLGGSYKSTLDITKLIRKLREARAWMRLPIPKPKKGR